MAATVVPVGSLQAKMRDVTRTEPANKPVKIPLSADHHERARSSGLWYLGEVSVWWFLKGLLLGEECASRPNGGAVETMARHNQQQRESVRRFFFLPATLYLSPHISVGVTAGSSLGTSGDALDGGPAKGTRKIRRSSVLSRHKSSPDSPQLQRPFIDLPLLG